MLGKKRRVFILFLLLLFLMPLSASLKLGTALTPAFLLDGYPLLKPGESDVYSPANDFLDDVSMENTWETLQDSLLRYERRQSLASVFLEVENKPFSLAILVDIRGALQFHFRKGLVEYSVRRQHEVRRDERAVPLCRLCRIP